MLLCYGTVNNHLCVYDCVPWLYQDQTKNLDKVCLCVYKSISTAGTREGIPFPFMKSPKRSFRCKGTKDSTSSLPTFVYS